MKRWYQFANMHSVSFGYGTEEQAKRCLARRNDLIAMNFYTMTELDEVDEPFAESVVVDLDSGLALPTRYKLRQQSWT
jgi:hypothetical protein